MSHPLTRVPTIKSWRKGRRVCHLLNWKERMTTSGSFVYFSLTRNKGTCSYWMIPNSNSNAQLVVQLCTRTTIQKLLRINSSWDFFLFEFLCLLSMMHVCNQDQPRRLSIYALVVKYETQDYWAHLCFIQLLFYPCQMSTPKWAVETDACRLTHSDMGWLSFAWNMVETFSTFYPKLIVNYNLVKSESMQNCWLRI